MARRKNTSQPAAPTPIAASTVPFSSGPLNTPSSPSAPPLSSSSSSSTSSSSTPPSSPSLERPGIARGTEGLDVDHGQGKITNVSDLPSLVGKPKPTVVVNNSHLGELKLASDDVVRTILNDIQFQQSHKHTDIKLLLGYLGIFVAASTVGWSYKVGFEQSKNFVWGGVILYAVLSAVQVGYTQYVEGGKIYEGKRKSLSKRIETELITVSSRSRPSSHSNPPLYSLTITYRRSANNNKSLIRRKKQVFSLAYSDFVDQQGGIEQSRLSDWVTGLVRDVVGEETGAGGGKGGSGGDVSPRWGNGEE